MVQKHKLQLKKSDIAILVVTISIVITVVILTLIFWKEVKDLFDHMLNGVEIVKEFIVGLGIKGISAIFLLVMFCFFIPFFTSIPFQIAAIIGYGMPFATLLVGAAIAIGCQLVFLFNRNIKTFSTPKQTAKRLDMEERIANSKYSIFVVLILAYAAPGIPFLLIATIAAASGLKWWKYTIITTFGPIPDIIVTLLIGNNVVNSSSPALSIALLVGLVILITTSIIFKDKIFDLVFKHKKVVATPNEAGSEGQDGLQQIEALTDSNTELAVGVNLQEQDNVEQIVNVSQIEQDRMEQDKIAQPEIVTQQEPVKDALSQVKTAKNIAKDAKAKSKK
ncbi:MAG: VTT domain-containing protein [Clostridia bacterium]